MDRKDLLIKITLSLFVLFFASILWQLHGMDDEQWERSLKNMGEIDYLIAQMDIKKISYGARCEIAHWLLKEMKHPYFKAATRITHKNLEIFNALTKVHLSHHRGSARIQSHSRTNSCPSVFTSLVLNDTANREKESYHYER